ncbi:hypothetical protein ACFLZP_03005 [Patescibacteria group bacterium]
MSEATQIGEQIVERKALTEAQKARVEAFFKAQPVNRMILEVLTDQPGLDKIGLHGGTAQMLVFTNLETGKLGLGKAEIGERPQAGAGWGDADWVVGGLRAVGQGEIGCTLAERLEEAWEGKYDVHFSGNADYPRIQITTKDGVEVASVDDLEGSVSLTRERQKVLGQTLADDDWELYVGTSSIRAEAAILFPAGDNLDQARVLQQPGASVNLDLNPRAMATVENYKRLRAAGRPDLAAGIPSEICYAVGKKVLLSTYQVGFGYYDQGESVRSGFQALIEEATDKDLYWGRQWLAERLSRALGYSYAMVRMNAGHSGIFSLFSPTFARAFERNYFLPEGSTLAFNRYTDLLIIVENNRDKWPFLGQTMEGFLLLSALGLGMEEQDLNQTLADFRRNWFPRSMKQLAHWGNKQPVMTEIYDGDIILTYRKLCEDPVAKRWSTRSRPEVVAYSRELEEMLQLAESTLQEKWEARRETWSK